MNQSKKYLPGYLEIERIQEEAKRIGEELGRKAGEKNKALEMAQLMKAKGEPLEKILEYTGLSKSEIEKIHPMSDEVLTVTH